MSDKVSVAEGAGEIGVAVVTLRKWLRDGRLPYFRVGRRVVLSRADIREFLTAHRVEAAVGTEHAV